MKFTKIRRTVTIPGFDNISMEGEIEEGETVEQADHLLCLRIKAQIDDDNHKQHLMFERASLQRRVDELLDDLKLLEKCKKERLEFFKENNIEFEEVLQSDIPF